MPGDDDDELDLLDPDSNHFNNYTVNFSQHSIDTFVRNSNLDSKALNIFHHNSRSIMKHGKLDEYEIFFEAIKNPFNILIFTETWLTCDKMDHCKIQGFSPIHLIRPNDQNIEYKERGGGISIFVRNDIKFKHRYDLDIVLPYMECCFIETMFNNKKYIIAGMYRIPNTNINFFIEKFNEIIEPLKSSFEVIILGDFNINLFNDDINKNLFEICLQSNYLIPTILGATRIATKTLNNGQIVSSKTLIDNAIIKFNMKHSSGLIDSFISDHFPIYISLPEIIINKMKTEKVIQYRQVTDITKGNFQLAIKRTQFNLSQNEAADRVFSGFHNTFNELYSTHFPIKEKTLNHKDEIKPWIDDTLKNRMKIRDNLYKLAFKKKISHKIFKDFKNLLTDQTRKAKAKYFENEFNKNSHNIKKTWSIINDVIRPKKSKQDISLLDDNGSDVQDSKVSVQFVDYFTSIADNLTAQLPNSPIHASDYLRNRNPNTFVFLQANSKDVETVINDLKDNGIG